MVSIDKTLGLALDWYMSLSYETKNRVDKTPKLLTKEFKVPFVKALVEIYKLVNEK